MNDPVKPFETVSGFGGGILATWLKPDANEILNPNHNHYFLLPSLYFYLFTFYFCFVLKCPTCGKPAVWQDNPSRPFCSERCKLIDFGRWSNGEYRVPGKSINPSDIIESPQPDQASAEEDENGEH